MTTIEQLLGNLLLKHNCVIIPSFGGFVAQQVSARVDFTTGKMFPPRKSLLFNKQLLNNDGLLVSEYASANQISFDQAAASVAQKVNDWNKQLKAGERIELDRVGYIFLDREKNVCFEQDRFFNLLLESFGLGQVNFITEEDVKIAEQKVIRELKPVPEISTKKEVVPQTTPEKEQTKIVAISQVETPVTEKEVVLPPARRKAWRYVAAACLLPIAFYSFWIPMKTDVLESGVLSFSDFNPFHTRTEGSYERVEQEGVVDTDSDKPSLEAQIEDLSTDVEVYTYEYDEDFTIPVKLEKDNEPVQPEDVQSSPEVQPNAIHFIVGCFGQESNATNLVAKLKSEGFDARIVDVHNGLHRVSAGSALSLEAHHQIKSQAQTAGYVGWTLN